MNNQLLEKYHLNTCTAEERKMVEEWLFNTDVDELDAISLPENKNDIKRKNLLIDFGLISKLMPTFMPK